MNRYRSFIIASVLCFYASLSYAASIGNPIKPVGHLKFAVGTEANFVLDRELELTGETTSGASFNEFELSKVTEGYTKLILGITDYVNVFMRLGATKINGLEIKLSSGEDISIETDSTFSYAFGANAVYQIHSDELHFIDLDNNFIYFIGLGGEFSFFDADATELYVSGLNVTNTSGQIESTQYQINIFSGIEFILDENCSLIPYIGGFWDGLNLKTGKITYSSNDHISFDAKADDQFGFAVGLDVKLSDNVGVNIEAKFLGAQVMSAGGIIKF
ncbi:MAG TPA: hypothetical protein ENH41_04775 [Candidatus Omnitrophica bacterium]|nr:hypothetical protein [Candidatus Omnitrophota bacterium]